MFSSDEGGSSKYGSSSSGIILVGGVDGMPFNRFGRLLFTFGIHSELALSQTYLLVRLSRCKIIPVVMCKYKTPLTVFFGKNRLVIERNLCFCSFEHRLS